MNIDEQRLNFSEQIIPEKSMKSVHEHFIKCWWTIIRKLKNVEQIIYENKLSICHQRSCPIKHNHYCITHTTTISTLNKASTCWKPNVFS